MVRVTVLGAAGGIGQPLSLLLKTSPLVSQLNLYDIRNVHGVAADISHVNTDSKVLAFQGNEELGAALAGAQLVVLTAGVPRKPGMSRDDLFSINAGIVQVLVTAFASHSPDACLLIITNPVNSTVPIAVETLKRLGKLRPNRVMGVTSLDVMRAQSFLKAALGPESNSISTVENSVTVVGGHSGPTIVPLMKNKDHQRRLRANNKYDDYIHRVQFGGDEVVKAKAGAGSATLSMASAGFCFSELVLRSIRREPIKPYPAFVYLGGLEGGAAAGAAIAAAASVGEAPDYFAVPVVLRDGEISSLDTTDFKNIDNAEGGLLKTAVEVLKDNIRKGRVFASKQTKL
ncbi:HFL104Cp [Eremothecium sinecaudum]|uniref:malate dehydrogenase n=1 Tax=Eremothecium sinecaudum TaxID=45286 RepID=A0A109UZS1_9SACH|nr:HFL104Cp [Eremothecium sinecaudum]AMD21752.1 HFL104Cp [Eremothecium sinecaudum]